MTEAEWLGCTDPMPMVGLVWNRATDRKLRLLAVASCRRVWELLGNERSRHAVETAELHADGHVDDDQLDTALAGAVDAFAALHADQGGPDAGAAAAADAGHDTTHQRGYSSEILVARWCLAQAAAAAAQPPSEEGGVPYLGWESLPMIAHALAILRPGVLVERAPFPEDHPMFASRGVYTERLSLDEQVAQADLIRDIVGNPFRPAAIDPSWLAWNDGTVVKLARGIYDDRAFDRLPVLADALEDAGCSDPEVLAHCRRPGNHVRGCFAVDLVLSRE